MYKRSGATLSRIKVATGCFDAIMKIVWKETSINRLAVVGKSRNAVVRKKRKHIQKMMENWYNIIRSREKFYN